MSDTNIDANWSLKKRNPSAEAAGSVFFPASVGSFWKYDLATTGAGPPRKFNVLVTVVHVDCIDANVARIVVENKATQLPDDHDPATRYHYHKEGDWILLSQIGEIKYDPPKPFLPVQPESEGSWSWKGSVTEGDFKYTTEENYTYRLTSNSHGTQSIVVTGPHGDFTYETGVGFIRQDHQFNDGSVGGWGSAHQKLVEYEVK
jgi:hypothetical protein